MSRKAVMGAVIILITVLMLYSCAPEPSLDSDYGVHLTGD